MIGGDPEKIYQNTTRKRAYKNNSSDFSPNHHGLTEDIHYLFRNKSKTAGKPIITQLEISTENSLIVLNKCSYYKQESYHSKHRHKNMDLIEVTIHLQNLKKK